MKEKKLRKDIIEKKLGFIVDSMDIISESLPEESEDFKNLGLIKEGIYKKLEFMIENVLDICNIINADMGLGIPDSEESVLEHLETKKIFDRKIISLIKEMKKFRNILIHKYGEINDKIAFESIKEGIGDFEIIIKAIDRFLKSKSFLCFTTP